MDKYIELITILENKIKELELIKQGYTDELNRVSNDMTSLAKQENNNEWHINKLREKQNILINYKEIKKPIKKKLWLYSIIVYLILSIFELFFIKVSNNFSLLINYEIKDFFLYNLGIVGLDMLLMFDFYYELTKKLRDIVKNNSQENIEQELEKVKKSTQEIRKKMNTLGMELNTYYNKENIVQRKIIEIEEQIETIKKKRIESMQLIYEEVHFDERMNSNFEQDSEIMILKRRKDSV